MSADPLAWLTTLEGVPSAYAAARDGIDVMLRDRGPAPHLARRPTAESLLRGAHASAVLEGSASTLAEVRDGAGDEVAQAAVRVSDRAAGAGAGAGPLAAAGAGPAARAGRGGRAARRPARPAPRRDGGRSGCAALAELLDAPTTAPALLVAAVVHADLATAAPFASHNGLVARAAERLVLVARGVDEKSLVVPEAGHLALRAAYESNLRGYRDGGAAGVHAWLLYAAEAYAAGAEASPLRRAADDA